MDPNSIIPETACKDSDASSSQKDALLNVHGSVAVTTHETENKSSSTMKAAAPNGSHHYVTQFSDESYYRDSVLPEHRSDVDCLNDSSSINEAPNKIDNKISGDSNSDDLKLNCVYPHYPVHFTGFSAQYVLNTVKLIVIWVYEDPTLFRGGGRTRKI
ncbi:unnamed protein product [Schistosoma spindalis]|nr:unnamed protein product [Schistosoma spindale]